MNTLIKHIKNALVRLRAKALTILGDIKIYKFPLFMVYDPSDYAVDGNAMNSVIDLIRPGDVLLRGYSHYLDGKFIPQIRNESVDRSKAIGEGWSHGAIYVGDETVIHAVAEGVSQIHLLDFMQCDRIAVFRPKTGSAVAIRRAKSMLAERRPYDFDFSDKDSSLYCFELVAMCYRGTGLKKYAVSKLFGLLKRNVYLAQSFVESDEFKLVYCHNPKSGIIDRRAKRRRRRKFV